jgi:hypothetical protein
MSEPISKNGRYQDTGLSRTSFEKRAAALKAEGILWHSAWKDLQKYCAPTRGFFDDTRPNTGYTIDHKTLVDSTAEEDFGILASGMLSGLTSPSRPWVRPELDDADLMDYSPVKEWLDIVGKRLLDVYAKSNVYGSLYSIYEEVATFGTACGFLQEDYRDIIRLRVFTIGEYFYGCGPDGRVNAFYHRFWMTVSQMIKEFGYENCSKQVQQSFNNNQSDQWRVVNHLVEENDSRVTNYVDYRNMAFRSIYWEDGDKSDSYLRLGGYQEFPILAPRWVTTTTADCYGRSPGWKMLGDVKMLQKMQKDKLLALAKVIRPPVQVDASVQGEVNMAPDGVTRTSGMVPNSGVRSAYQIAPDLNAIEMSIEKTKAAIHRKSFADLFKMMIEADRTGTPITATEVMERQSEKLSILGPVLEKLESELLNPLNDRTLSIMMRNNLLPPPPKEIQGMNLKFKYISVLAQAQRMAGVTAVSQWVNGVLQESQINPESLDVIDFDEKNAELGEMLGVPAKIVNDPNKIALKRKARVDAQRRVQQSQELAQMAESGAKVAGAVKDVGTTPVGVGSALDNIIGGITGKN